MRPDLQLPQIKVDDATTPMVAVVADERLTLEDRARVRLGDGRLRDDQEILLAQEDPVEGLGQGEVAHQLPRRAEGQARRTAAVEAVAAESTGAIPLGRYGKPEEYGDVVAFLASERAAYLTGSVIRVDGGLIASI